MRTQTRTNWKRALRHIGVFATFAVVSCGGGEQLGGIQGSGRTSPATVVGPITGFGSIFVNGVEYATSGAQVRIDGQAATESQLRVGQVVTLKATQNEDGRTGVANEVAFVVTRRGPSAPWTWRARRSWSSARRCASSMTPSSMRPFSPRTSKVCSRARSSK